MWSGQTLKPWQDDGKPWINSPEPSATLASVLAFALDPTLVCRGGVGADLICQSSSRRRPESWSGPLVAQ